ncbi:hypothetical protein SEA_LEEROYJENKINS_129 [Microbacterium phage LeeroyJenkins]|nr:hypothetical protein SEA_LEEROYJENKINS_3 [Microbacterium phage LeeroyJenkins]QDK01523.1 hypothetical protein SEA_LEEROYJENKINS_129 [Microbacterium phage LeeroyJenkins]QOC59328.1 hypothetical protein SEA_LIFES_2 [Microbacterium phage Lifes]QOC59443.1 hypothetical protein SEA_LIFES_122 [Microbacterium phage Lifes]
MDKLHTALTELRDAQDATYSDTTGEAMQRLANAIDSVLSAYFGC